MLAVVFAALSRALPADGGPYAYTRDRLRRARRLRRGLGLLGLASGSATPRSPPGAVSYTSAVAPWIVSVPGRLGAGHDAGGRLAAHARELPRRARRRLGAGGHHGAEAACRSWRSRSSALFFVRGDLVSAHAGVPLTPRRHDGRGDAHALGAARPRVRDGAGRQGARTRRRTIPRATLVGTVVSALVCALACSIVLVLVPQARLAASNAPFADAARGPLRDGHRHARGACSRRSAPTGRSTAGSCCRASCRARMARDGRLPAGVRAGVSRRGTPVIALVSTSLLVSAARADELPRGLVEVFTFMILLSTTATLVAYLACSLALLVLLRRGRGRRAGARAGSPSRAPSGRATRSGRSPARVATRCCGGRR